MSKPEAAPDFVYVSYIKSTPQKVWAAITNPEFSRNIGAMNSTPAGRRARSGTR